MLNLYRIIALCSLKGLSKEEAEEQEFLVAAEDFEAACKRIETLLAEKDSDFKFWQIFSCKRIFTEVFV